MPVTKEVRVGQSLICQYEDGKELTIAPVSTTGTVATLEVTSDGLKRVLVGDTEHKKPEPKQRATKPPAPPADGQQEETARRRRQ